ncbi:MAG: octanoyltransferase LipM [Chloroflexota bacterium]|nr:lipoate--protein ligase family protein [Caldilinea sp.]GIK73599.1 MAG: octanoyltransferase LipM [Chloroflexota bacterium]
MSELLATPDVFVDLAELEDAQTTTTWRLIIDAAPRSGAANMAIDQAIAEACATGDSPPTLRFYRWNPPAVSLGRLQPINDIDEQRVAAFGYEIVRRPTGGRAILHTDELTYSVAAAASHPLMHGGVMDAYLRISNALIAGLRLLGVDADKAPGDVRVGADVSAVCFETPSAYEITAGGRKLMGSAQSRRANYVLQHGSLPLVGDITRLIDVLALPAAQAEALRRELRARACTLAQALGVDDASDLVEFTRVAGAMRRGFEQALNLELQPGALTTEEVRRSALLIRTQFGNNAWNRQR